MSKRSIARYLLSMGVSPQYKGYRYLVAALSATIANAQLLNQITTVLYPRVAQEFQTTPANVDRCIRTAIENVWADGNREILDMLFGKHQTGRPTNARFMAILTETLCLAGALGEEEAQ